MKKLKSGLIVNVDAIAWMDSKYEKGEKDYCENYYIFFMGTSEPLKVSKEDYRELESMINENYI